MTADRGPAVALEHRSVGDALAAQVARRPDAVAVVDGGLTLRYRDLDRLSGAVAAWLHARRRGEEPPVALVMDRGWRYVAAVAGAARAGWTYVPVDPRFPPERVRLLVAGSRSAAVLHDGAGGTDGVAAAHVDEVLAAAAPPPERAVQHPDQALYVMYTSGSTGRPKGVVVTHRGVLRLVVPGRYAGLSQRTRCLVAAPIAFDASTFELWGPLLNGGTCVVLPGSTFSFADLGRTVAAGGVDTVWLTAGLLNAIVDEEVGALAGVANVLAGGEQLSARHVRELRAAHPGVVVTNGYGPTEATTFTTTHVVRPEDLDGRIPIGRPLVNTSVCVLDAALEPSPPGAAGELCVGGDGVARGYLGSPGATAEAFVPDPHGPAGARLYRTADRARWRDDGTLEFLGRVDGQVKVRGHRVEVGEVEQVLRGHPRVRDAVVVPRYRGGECGGLDARVVVTSGCDARTLTAWLEARLPAYMIPRVLVVTGLERTLNGKTERTTVQEGTRS